MLLSPSVTYVAARLVAHTSTHAERSLQRTYPLAIARMSIIPAYESGILDNNPTVVRASSAVNGGTGSNSRWSTVVVA